jgi:acetylornithine deacetylase/succinyl-diaminopimelate desuccinylase-like protein
VQVTSVTELLQALVRIPSVNPTGDPGTPHTGEKAIADWLVGWLRAEFPAARVELRDVLPDRPNVVVRFSDSGGKKPRILFAPHTDTVSVGGMTIEPFGAELRDGKVWGRGTSDTKGSMAAMLWALRASRDLLPDLEYEIWFAGLCSEEAGQHGAYTLAQQERFDLVIAGEPTGLDAVVAHKGALWLSLTTRGRAVHAAEPHRGENAIYKMADVLRCVRDELATMLRGEEHPLLGHTTISAGTISGGSKINIVPDICHAEVDIRYLPGGNPLEAVSAKLREVCPDLEIEHIIAQPMLTDVAHPVIAKLQSCGSRCIGAPWFSDAGIFSQFGTAAIALGPGSIAQAHTKDEFIAVADLEAGVDFFTRFLRTLRSA